MNHTEINTIGLLANYLKLDKSELGLICDNEFQIIELGETKIFSSENVIVSLLLKKYIIPKKVGFRTVYSPYSDTLINCLKILNTNLSKLYEAPSCVHGFVKGRNIKTNATPHLGKKFVYQFDIKNYFESIRSVRIIESLQELGFSEHTSDLISRIVCYNGHLVQGFHTSPTIANIVFRKLDELFEDLGENVDYTRYADDLFFSSDVELNIQDEIESVLLRFGFTLNERKYKLMKRGQNQYVTGLTVFDELHPRISKRKKKELRQEIYYIKKYGYKGHVFHLLGVTKKEYKNDFGIQEMVELEMKRVYAKVNGWLMFINSVEPEFSQKYLDILRDK